MKQFWQSLLIVICICVCVGCKKSENSGNEPTPTVPTDSIPIGDNENDFVENQTWTSSIDIVWSGASANVSGSASGVIISSNNGYVSISSSAKEVVYHISGNGTGQLSIYSDYKFQLAFEGLTLSCSNGPAINNQCKKTCYVVLNGTNSLTDGSTYASSNEDRKAALFSEGQLCFSGSGSLSITGKGKHALASDDYIRFCAGMTGSVTLNAQTNDGIHVNDGLLIEAGTVQVTAVDEGLRCDSNAIAVTGGKVYVTSQAEGIESKGAFYMTGGEVYVKANDDAINSGEDLLISGGLVCAHSVNNDGIDANGNCYIQGGVVYAIGSREPEVAIDANSEEQKKLYFISGTLVAIGGLESGASISQNCYQASSWAKSTWYALTVGDTIFAFKTPSSGGSTLVVSGAATPTLASGVSANGTEVFNGTAYYPATFSGGSSVSLSSYSPSQGKGK